MNNYHYWASINVPDRHLTKGVRNMNSEMNQIELTDQELEQVIGGFGIGFAGVSSGVTLGGASGVNVGGQSIGLGAGSHVGVGFATNQSIGNQFAGPFGISDNFGYSGGTAVGVGF
jgi:bacteriocin-like protein